jgi:hypothetical protein
MRIHKNSELGRLMKKSFSARNKRKIVNHIYSSGKTSRWPLKTIPYIFDSTICKLILALILLLQILIFKRGCQLLKH